MAQSSTNSTPVTVINGQKYVLVPERTFQNIEKLTLEVPALRAENTALKAKDDNSEKVIAGQAQLLTLKDQTIAAQDKAIEAGNLEAEALRRADDARAKALGVAETRIKELEGKVKKANRRALFAILGGVAAILIGR